MKNQKTRYNRIPDPDLKAALEAVRSDMLSELPPLAEIPKHEFPVGFKDKIKAHTARRSFYKHFLKTAAAILICLALTSGVVFAVSPEARADVIRWLRSETPNSVDYTFFGDPERSRLPEVEFGWLPGEYEIVKADHFPFLTYQLTPLQKNNKLILFSATYMIDGTVSCIIGESPSPLEVDVRGVTGEFYLDPRPDEYNVLLWIDEKNNIMFELFSKYDQEIIMKIAEAMEIKDL